MLIRLFWARILLNFSNLGLFFYQKWVQICFSPLALDLLDIQIKVAADSSLAQNNVRCTPAGMKSLLELQICHFFANLNSIIIKIEIIIFDKL